MEGKLLSNVTCRACQGQFNSSDEFLGHLLSSTPCGVCPIYPALDEFHLYSTIPEHNTTTTMPLQLPTPTYSPSTKPAQIHAKGMIRPPTKTPKTAKIVPRINPSLVACRRLYL